MASRIEIVTEDHYDVSARHYIESLAEVESGQNSVFMTEAPLALNGLFEAYYADEISIEDVTKFLKGYLFEEFVHTAEARAETIEAMKEHGVNIFAYDNRYSHKAFLFDDTMDTTDYIVKTKEDKLFVMERYYDNSYLDLQVFIHEKTNNLSETFNQTEAIKEPTITVSELKEVVDRGVWHRVPEIEGANDEDLIPMSQLQNIMDALEADKIMRSEERQFAIDLSKKYGNKSDLSKKYDDLVRQRFEEGDVSTDAINAELIVSAAAEGGIRAILLLMLENFTR